ncbi:hypothetical protein C9374_001436 [Naegleria lovaniensis]|uniref:Uncharacterized protein n=1 Tax=Naegleria lovaniensis TaxID=51637 RepID=A0AA88GVM7_NAELO|nr:uncharacterized protein C9374_001436 [Naegleria lovaniensis]KAG2387842.1 hypothetical protein C9374_001436 [Naegleria lovaniensis]
MTKSTSRRHQQDVDEPSQTSTRCRIVYNPQNIDRSKRVAPGCEINLNNILAASKTRSRSNVNYRTLNNSGVVIKTNRKSKNNIYMRTKSTEKIQKTSKKKNSLKNKRSEEANDDDKENVVNHQEDAEESTGEEEEKEETCDNSTSSAPPQSVELVPSFTAQDEEMDESVYQVSLSSQIKTLLTEKLGAVLPETESKKHRRTFGVYRLPLAVVEWGRIWANTVKSTNLIKLFKCETSELSFSTLEFTEMDLEEEEKNSFAFLKGTDDRIVIGSGNDTLLAVKLEEAKNCEDLLVYALKDSAPHQVFGPFKLSWILENCESDGQDTPQEQ